MRGNTLTLDDWHAWAQEARFSFASSSGPNFHKLIEMNPYGDFFVRNTKNETVYMGQDVGKAIAAYNKAN